MGKYVCPKCGGAVQLFERYEAWRERAVDAETGSVQPVAECQVHDDDDALTVTEQNIECLKCGHQLFDVDVWTVSDAGAEDGAYIHFVDMEV